MSRENSRCKKPIRIYHPEQCALVLGGAPLSVYANASATFIVNVVLLWNTSYGRRVAFPTSRRCLERHYIRYYLGDPYKMIWLTGPVLRSRRLPGYCIGRPDCLYNIEILINPFRWGLLNKSRVTLSSQAIARIAYCILYKRSRYYTIDNEMQQRDDWILGKSVMLTLIPSAFIFWKSSSTVGWNS